MEDAASLIAPISKLEIDDAIRNFDPLKSPRPDWFNSVFFKICWPIVGEDVTNAITDFFQNGKMLKQLKHTFITLILKEDNPTTAADFRSISLTN